MPSRSSERAVAKEAKCHPFGTRRQPMRTFQRRWQSLRQPCQTYPWCEDTQQIMGLILDVIKCVMGRAYGSACSCSIGIHGSPGAPYWQGKGVRLASRRLARAGAVFGGFPVRGGGEGPKRARSGDFLAKPVFLAIPNAVWERPSVVWESLTSSGSAQASSGSAQALSGSPRTSLGSPRTASGSGRDWFGICRSPRGGCQTSRGFQRRKIVPDSSWYGGEAPLKSRYQSRSRSAVLDG